MPGAEPSQHSKSSQPSQPSQTTARQASDARQVTAMRELGHLPCRVTAEVSVRGVALRQVLALEPGVVIDSRVPAGRDLEIKVNGVRVGWGQGKNEDGRVVVRVTDFD